MPFHACHHHVRCVRLALGVLLCSSCASDEVATRVVELRASPLEVACATGPADVLGDVTSILAASDPLDPLQAQAYGSESCAGYVFEFDNPDEEPLRGAWIQAGSESALNEAQCSRRSVEADYWGFKDKEWTRLASAFAVATFEPNGSSDTGACRLEALIENAGTFEKLRISARVTDGSETYPMYACVW